MVSRVLPPWRLLRHRPPGHRSLVILLGSLALTLFVTGCVSMPNGGPVRSYAITQSPGANNEHYLQFVPPPP